MFYKSSMPATEDTDLFDGDFLARLERVRLQVRRIFSGSHRAERRSRRTGSSLEFADYRNYVAGDDPRRIDWSIYGRIERLMMKLTEEEEDLDVAILIDTSASMHWHPSSARRSSKFTLTQQLAAALAYLSLHNLDRVGLWYFDSTLRAESGYFRGRPAFHDALRFLRASPASPGATDLADSLGRFGKRQRRRGLAIVISDCLDPAGFERGLGAVAGRHFALHLLHVMDRAECDPKEKGDLLLRDCEGTEEMAVTASPALLTAYRQEAQRFCETVKSWCAKRNAGYSFVLSDAPFDDVILRVFRKDGLVR
jgi:uncharacterized protein (DUF58 family)